MALRMYGQWAGNPKGTVEDIACCIKQVYPANAWYGHQCSRKRGYGADGLYCKQHSKIKEGVTMVIA